MNAPAAEIEVGEEMVAGFAKKGLGQVQAATTRDRGVGPFRRLVLRGAMVIDGTGAHRPGDLRTSSSRMDALLWSPL
jgi:imidazolonepropionase